MIKNILYSLFLHLILAFFIYVNFRIIKNEIIEVDRGISVGIMSFKNDNDSSKIVKNEENPTKIVKKVEKSHKKPEKSPKIEKKPVKTEKIAKKSPKKPEKSSSKPKKEDDLVKNNEVKSEDEEKHQEEVKKEEITPQPEKEEEKPEEIDKNTPKLTKEEEILATNDKDQDKQKLYTDEEIIDDLEEINLSAREKFNIQTQLRGCFRRASKENPAPSGFEMVVNIKADQDGAIDFNFDNFVDAKRYENPHEIGYKRMADNVAQALELCNPLRNLPADKYDYWKAFSIRFSSE